MPAHATVLGDGQLGLVAADILRENGVATTIWSPVAEEVARLAKARQSPRLPGFQVHRDIGIVAGADEALREASFVVAAIPTQFLRATATRLAPALGRLEREPLIASATKGIEVGTGARPSEIWQQATGITPVVVSGPNIAGELARRLPAAMVAASADAAAAARAQAFLSRPWLRVYTNDDPLGVEVCGALKNVIALAAGMLDGLQAGFNAKGMLLARGLAEMRRFGTALGAAEETFAGLAGLGDLATTCSCPEGRNRATGESIARGKPLADVLAASPSVIEGIPTAQAAVEAAARLGIEMPIAEAVHAVTTGKLSPAAALERLMGRTAKGE